MSFNIEEYINSLPLDIEIIDVSNKKLTFIPDLSRFTKLTHLICSGNKLTQLPPLNNELRHLNCSDNLLTKLPQLNKNLKFLTCENNKLTELPSLINTKLTGLKCNSNKLTQLPPLNNELLHLNCDSNNIKYLPNLSHSLFTLYFKYNPIDDILKTFVFKIGGLTLGKKIKILNSFRYTYYCLRFKTQFKKWLWEKVREPKIMQKFHPDHLNTLKETDDLEEFLEEWVK